MKEGWRKEDYRINLYVCDTCRGMISTVDVDKGVTPFMVLCKSPYGCEGIMKSLNYPKPRPIPFHIKEPEWEWYAPARSEFAKLTAGDQDHVERGGLLLRARTDAEPRSHSD